MTLAVITDQPLSLQDHVDAVACTAAGAVATFLGQVRNHDPAVQGEVVGLEYSSHPQAGEVMARIAAEVGRHEDVLGLAVSHRTGVLRVGEVAVVAAVATAHRTRAFEVCAELVEQVKAELPVWKRELLADGSHVWVGV